MGNSFPATTRFRVMSLLRDSVRATGRWTALNAIRSNWNYKHAAWYGDVGEKKGKLFRAVANNDDLLFSHIKTKSHQANDEGEAVSVALASAVLIEAVEKVDKRLRR